jgi:hypothetical protein
VFFPLTCRSALSKLLEHSLNPLVWLDESLELSNLPVDFLSKHSHCVEKHKEVIVISCSVFFFLSFFLLLQV